MAITLLKASHTPATLIHPPASHALPALPTLPTWSLADLSGRLIEISAGPEAASLTAAFSLVLEAQLTGDRAAWVTLEDSTFFPPDVADGGIDLDALAVIRVRDARIAGRAADHLARSGGFGLIVIDLSGHSSPTTRHHPLPTTDHRPSISGALPVPLLTRLLGLAREHASVIALLTRKPQDSPSVHSLISLRVEARWRPSTSLGTGLRDGRHELSLRALKDKRRGPGWTHVEICRGPAGVR